MSYTSTFGGSPVAPSNPSYSALSISANTALVWPLETTGGYPYVAELVDVTATGSGLSLAMPPGNTGSTGVAGLFTNVGSNSYTLTDQSGNSIATIAPTQQWLIALTDNTTANGTWRAYQLAATTSTASAGALAGGGLQAVSTALQVALGEATLASATLITSGYRATLLVYNGGSAGTWQLDTIANLTLEWFCAYTNTGAAAVTISCSGGATINGAGTLVVAPGQSGWLICASGGFYAFGGGLVGVLPIAAGGTGAATAPLALTSLGGTSVGTQIFTAPSAAAVIALLGLNDLPFSESTIAGNTTLSSANLNTLYVATASLVMSIPASTTLSVDFVFGAYAYGGQVTITPQFGADQINGQTAGTSFILEQGAAALFATDANGNFWPVILTPGLAGAWAVAGGSSDVITATYSPLHTALTEGLTLAFRATATNTTTTPTFAPDGLTAHTITARGGVALTPGQIPAAGAEIVVRYNLANTRWELQNYTISAQPIGMIVPFAGTSVPSGWLLCYGQVLVQSSYPNTYAVIGSTWNTGGEGAGNFRLPDFRGRALFGADNMGGSAANRLTTASLGTAAVVGVTGGSELLAQHNHPAVVTDPGHLHTVGYNNVNLTLGATTEPVMNGVSGTENTSTATTGITVAISNTGTGAAQNVPPAAVLNLIIYAPN